MQSIHQVGCREHLRKRYGHELADKLMSWWYHWNIDEPLAPDEVIFFYILGEREVARW
jgi:hypothetical protein